MSKSTSFRVIIAGSRSFDDYLLLESKMDKLLQNQSNVTVVCGEARGADSLGRQYAEKHGLNILSFPADWKNLGKKAGHIRNVQMANNADALVAFWDGKSGGTKHMIETAKLIGLQVRIVYF